VIALPPLTVGAVQVTTALVFPGVAVTDVGAPGGAAGITAADGADAGPVPMAFVAVTVKVYAVPFVSPTRVAVFAPVVVAVMPSGDEVTV